MKSYAILCDLLLNPARLQFCNMLSMLNWGTVTIDGLLISFHYCDQMTDMIHIYSLLLFLFVINMMTTLIVM